jgi:hypothetical protein
VIGVMARVDQAAAVDEFFQLFKTPWEPYRPGRRYDVVVSTLSETPEVDARLLVIYGGSLRALDSSEESVPRRRCEGGSLNYRGVMLPVYGELRIFGEGDAARALVSSDTEVAGVIISREASTVLLLGYDLFDEVAHLLSKGQPTSNAHIPVLDIHVTMLREWIVEAGLVVVEIPPVPAGHRFAVCLTHDIDFVGIRNHWFDHTMWGFLYRATVGALRNVVRGRLSVSRMIQNWRAAVSLPLVYLGWIRDFWDPFEWYLRVERNLPTTYFFIPFKGRSGERVPAPNASRRAAKYDFEALSESTATLRKHGCEVGVHGIDAWHSVEKGREELNRVSACTGGSSSGIRMHWLLRDENTHRILEQAGFAYDSTDGYNEAIGYLNGTTQVFRPLTARTLLELPLHIQDGAMFFPQRLDLSETEAWQRCGALIDHVRTFGGVLTVLWHDRSPAPERLWGEFYIRLVERLRSIDGWFGTASQVVSWFRNRREVSFREVERKVTARWPSRESDDAMSSRFVLRVHRRGAAPVDIPWSDEATIDLDRILETPEPLTIASVATAGGSPR